MAEISRRGAVAATLAAGVAMLGATSAVQAGIHQDAAADEKMKIRAAVKRWYNVGPKNTLADVVNYVNANPAQGAGEIVVLPRTDGKFDLLIYI